MPQPTKQPQWKFKDGKKVPMDMMTSQQLQDAIAFSESRYMTLEAQALAAYRKSAQYFEKIKQLRQELQKRSIVPKENRSTELLDKMYQVIGEE